MKLDTTPQLDFGDVLIRPKRTILSSRSEVQVRRTFTFPHCKRVVECVPIIASNMDTTGTFNVYDVLVQFQILTCMNKFYTLQDYKDRYESRPMNPDLFMVSTGIKNSNFEEMCKIIDYTKCSWICIDIANGYMQKFVDFCKKVRQKYPDKIIVAGNVATREMVEELIINFYNKSNLTCNGSD